MKDRMEEHDACAQRFFCDSGESTMSSDVIKYAHEN